MCRVTYLFRSNRFLAGLVELLNSLLIVTQILLTADENDGETAAEMQDFGNPLLFEHVSALSYLQM